MTGINAVNLFGKHSDTRVTVRTHGDYEKNTHNIVNNDTLFLRHPRWFQIKSKDKRRGVNIPCELQQEIVALIQEADFAHHNRCQKTS